eukprot:779469-Lingulodinium_polyedra.AAC.1
MIEANTVSGIMGQLDPKMQEEVSWHAVNGVRIQRTLAFFQEHQVRLKLIMLALVMEPMQWLTGVMLTASREIVDMCKPTLVVDSASCHTAPFVVVLQYVAGLLSGSCSRAS